jgi:hypothetical protein
MALLVNAPPNRGRIDRKTTTKGKPMQTTEKDNRAEEQAKAQLESILAMVRALDRGAAVEDWLKGKSDAEIQKLAEEADILGGPDLRERLAEEITQENFEPGGFEWDEEEARERIQEDPLSIQVREGWHSPGEEGELEEFEILLCTGGPAVRIRGELNAHKEPDRAWLEYQDWFTSWTELVAIESWQRKALLTYCQQFYFGE